MAPIYYAFNVPRPQEVRTVKFPRSQDDLRLVFLAAMFISGSPLRVWVHNGPHLSSSCSRLLISPRPKIISDARRPFSSFENEGGAHLAARNAGKRALCIRMLLISLASGIGGYAIAKTTQAVPDPPTIIAGNVAQESQYGTPKDVQNAIKELRSAFSTKNAVCTDVDSLRSHGVSQWDHRAGVWDYPLRPGYMVMCFVFQKGVSFLVW